MTATRKSLSDPQRLDREAADAGAGPTLASALTEATGRLTAAGVEAARRDARLLLASIVAGGASALLRDPRRCLSASESQRFEAFLYRRERREPISRIVGEREFWSLNFKVTPDTLDPRPDSETLVEGILEWVAGHSRPSRILDLGTGTGCLLLALLSELPDARGLGVDFSRSALEVAEENARSLGLSDRAEFRRGDWTNGLEGGWDVVLSNPPYIARGEIEGLAPEVSGYDPQLALSGGDDGLQAYRALIPGSARLLNPRGLLALEVGVAQAAAVEAMILANGLQSPWRRRDLSGVERCCFAVKAKK